MNKNCPKDSTPLTPIFLHVSMCKKIKMKTMRQNLQEMEFTPYTPMIMCNYYTIIIN